MLLRKNLTLFQPTPSLHLFQNRTRLKKKRKNNTNFLDVNWTLNHTKTNYHAI
jgi:hypothetical protein